MRDAVFVLSNFGIMLGYFYVGAFVAPHFKIDKWSVRLAGAMFFVTCGLTHLHMAVDVWFKGGVLHKVTWAALIIHVIQVIAVWVFVTGLYRQFVVGPRLHDA